MRSLQPGRTTLSRFLIEQLHDQDDHGQLASLLVDVGAAIKGIAAMTAKGALGGCWGKLPRRSPLADQQMRLDQMAHDELVRNVEWGGGLAGLLSARAAEPCRLPPEVRRGRYLLLCDPLGASGNFDFNVSVGTIFSILAYGGGAGDPVPGDYLRPGREQLAAGYAIYGPATMLVLTVGKGTHGFTLDREIGNFILTHPDLRIPEETAEFAINTSLERFWEPPVRRYVDECKAGATDIRARDFTMRWIASMVADVHRILMRGGVFLYPREVKAAARRGPRVRLLNEANPVALVVEQAGGAASTGRGALLDVVPAELGQATPVIFGSRTEVERLERYHREYDEGTDRPYVSPLFNQRSLYRDTAV